MVSRAATERAGSGAADRQSKLRVLDGSRVQITITPHLSLCLNRIGTSEFPR